jgi:hypothetical protein
MYSASVARTNNRSQIVLDTMKIQLVS